MENLRIHSAILQLPVSTAVAGSCVPSPMALVEFLFLVFVPVAQVLEHAFQGDHGNHSESTYQGTVNDEQSLK